MAEFLVTVNDQVEDEMEFGTLDSCLNYCERMYEGDIVVYERKAEFILPLQTRRVWRKMLD
jgi:hypothetical protein